MKEKRETSSSTIDKYLSWKYFCNEKDIPPRNISMETMALLDTIQVHAGTQNCVKLSIADASFTWFCKEYSKFIDFIGEAPEPYTSQLTFMVYPMFVHFYLELVIGGKNSDAQLFYSQHSDFFMKMPGYKDVVIELASILSSQDISDHSYFRMFRQEKCDIKLTDDCKEYLFQFLKNFNFCAILQFLGTYFYLEGDETEFIEVTSAHRMSNTIPSISPQVYDSQNYTILKNSIQHVLKEPASLPSLYVYNIWSATRHLINVDISGSNKFLVGAFEDSSLHLWNLHKDPSLELETPSHLWSNPANDLHREESLNQKVIRGHSGPAYGLCFLLEEEFFLSCSEDTTVRMWSSKKYENVHIYTGHCYPIWDVTICPFQLYFATASKDQTARLWMFDRSHPVRIFAGHHSDVLNVKFHPNCNYIATGSSDQSVRLWSVQEGRIVRVLSGHKGSVMALAFSPDGKKLASAGEDRIIKVWDLGSGSEIKTLIGHKDTLYSLSFSSDSSLLASSGMDNCVKIWDINSSPNREQQVGIDSETLLKECSSELVSSFQTKCSAHRFVRFGQKNLLLAAGITE